MSRNKNYQEYEEKIKNQEDDLKDQYVTLINTEKEENNRKTFFTVIICIIIVLVCILIAYFLFTRIYRSYNSDYNESDNNVKEENQSNANIIESYIVNYDKKGSHFHIASTQLDSQNFETHTFSIENNDSYTISYDILWTNVINNLEKNNGLVYTITRNGTDIKSNIIFPNKDEYILQNETINANEKNVYVLTYKFINDNTEITEFPNDIFDADVKITNVTLK